MLFSHPGGDLPVSIAAAAYIHQGTIPPDVSAALRGVKSVKFLFGDVAVCSAFQTARLPTLVLYNADGDETARACGDMHVADLIKQTVVD